MKKSEEVISLVAGRVIEDVLEAELVCGNCANFAQMCGDTSGFCELGVMVHDDSDRPAPCYLDSVCPDADWFDLL